MKRLLVIFSASFLYFFIAQSQIKVISNGNVGIDNDNPISTLSIGGDGTTEAKVYINQEITSGHRKALWVRSLPATGTSWSHGC